MSIPQPPNTGIGKTPPIATGVGLIPPVQPAVGSNKKASLLPLIFAVAAMICSLAIWLLFRGQVVAIYIPLFGYLLSPFSVVVMMGWETISQRKNTAQDPWFIPKPKLTLAIRVLALLSFVVAYPHIYSLANILAEYVPWGA
jgi:hypothetical protein